VTKRKVCVVVTARASYSRIKSVLCAIQQHKALELQLVVGASAVLDRYGNVISCMERDGFHIVAKVYMVLEGENLTTMAKTTGIGVLELATVFDNIKPDVVITVADRYETIATAIAASFMNIPVAHVQGGEVTGSIDEKVRHAVTKLSDIHFVATQKAADRVKLMGEEPSRVFVTGCPSIDLAAEVAKQAMLNFDPFEKYGGVGETMDISGGYVVVMQHPVTTEYEQAFTQVAEVLKAVVALDLPALWFWPNVDAGSDGVSKCIRIFREQNSSCKIHFFRHMMSEDFLRLLCNCRCLIGNSSVGIRETSFLGVPVVNVGNRQSGRERGQNVIDVGYNRSEIVDAVRKQLGHGPWPCNPLYGDGNAGTRIASLLSDVTLTIEKKFVN